MSLDPVMDDALAALETRVVRAVELIGALRRERDELRQTVAELEERVQATSGSVDPAERRAIEERLERSESERQRLAVERKNLTQRVEAILARLEYLESESVAH